MQPEITSLPGNVKTVEVEKALQRSLGGGTYENWFRDKTVLSITGNQLTVGVGSSFLQNWMQRRFRTQVAEVARAALGADAAVVFDVDSRVSMMLDDGSNPKPKPDHTEPPNGDVAIPAVTPRSGRRFADLTSFVEGPCHELPLAAVRHVCESPGAQFNPLFLHGGVGTGKTHLLEGIYRRIRRTYPSLKVVFLTSEAFANYFTQALREHTLPSFRQKFRNVDVLLVDDIDFLDSKRVIQEEFLHTFKQLESHGRQIVLTADRHPRLLGKLSDELMTRCLSGLVCRLESPELETRRRIVEQMAGKMNVSLAGETLQFVAERFKNNVRELEGAFNSLATYHGMTGKRVGLSAAKRVLANLERDCVKVVRMSDVEQAVCQLFGLEAVDLKSARRHRSVSQPRMLAMFLIRKYTRAAYSEIGDYFGGRNHATVISAEKKVKSWLADGTAIKVAAHSWTPQDVLESLEQQLQAS